MQVFRLPNSMMVPERRQAFFLLVHAGCAVCLPPSHPPLAPLSTTGEQMVHSRRRVIESPQRKCNCSRNYVLNSIGAMGVGGRPPDRGFNVSSPLDHRWDDAHRSCRLLPLGGPVLTFPPSHKERGDRNNCSRAPSHKCDGALN